MRNAYLRSAAWYQRKDRVKRRAQGLCEFCRWRPGAHCHHRTYDRYKHEPLEDLMLVCRECHEWIHGLHRRTLVCTRESLLLQGDSGKGLGPLWQDYLQRCKEGEHAVSY